MRAPHKNMSATAEQPELRLTARGMVWQWTDGTTLPVVAGGDGPAPVPTADPPAPPAPAPAPTGAVPPPPATDPPAPPRTFTQDEVNAIATREAAEAKRKAQAALADELGLPLEKVKELVAAADAAEQAAMTEAQRAEAAAKAAEAAALATNAEAAGKLRDAEVLLGLARAGGVATPKDADAATAAKAQADVAALVARELPDLGTDPLTAEHVDAAVAALRTRLPALFDTAAPATPGTPSGEPNGGAGQPPPSSNSTEPASRGAQRAAAMGLATPVPAGAGAAT